MLIETHCHLDMLKENKIEDVLKSCQDEGVEKLITIATHPDNLDSATFIASLYNRIRLCQDNHSPDELWDIGYDSYHRFKEDIETLSIAVDIVVNHVPRRSNRQQRKMQLYGLQGNLHLTGDHQTLSRLLPALQLGERLHIGKNTTMGLGQYRLKLTPLHHP